MKKLTILVAVLINMAIFQPVLSQDSELGIFLGTSHYNGDLDFKPFPSPSLDFNTMHLGFGVLYRYYFNPSLNFKTNIYYGNISGDDGLYADEDDGRRRRNLSFKSHVIEGSFQLEWNILPFVPGSQSYRFSPYLFGGLTIFHFNPKAELNGTWHELQPLGTEGQHIHNDKSPYSLLQIAIPLGLGFKYNISGLWNIGLEIGGRKTFTDYLDDVSGVYVDNDELRAGPNGELAANLADRNPSGQFSAGSVRGNPDRVDWYWFSGITISKTIRSFQCN